MPRSDTAWDGARTQLLSALVSRSQPTTPDRRVSDPREVGVSRPLNDLTDDQLDAAIAVVRSVLANGDLAPPRPSKVLR